MFERFLRGARPALVAEYGDRQADEVLDAARRAYLELRPSVPDIGGARNVFQPVMTVNGWIVALHRAMRARGHGADASVKISQAVFDGWLQSLPGAVLRTIGRLLLSSPSRWYLEQQARRSQKRQYSEDFVWRVERGTDGEVSLVFDECAVNKWYDEQDVPELKPYCNFFDVTYSRLMGMGVDASETIGLGCERCALRFKQGRSTAIPPTLDGIVSTPRP